MRRRPGFTSHWDKQGTGGNDRRRYQWEPHASRYSPSNTASSGSTRPASGAVRAGPVTSRKAPSLLAPGSINQLCDNAECAVLGHFFHHVPGFIAPRQDFNADQRRRFEHLGPGVGQRDAISGTRHRLGLVLTRCSGQTKTSRFRRRVVNITLLWILLWALSPNSRSTMPSTNSRSGE